MIEVTIVRIYVTEGSHLLKPISDYLHNKAKVRGVSVFRAISGFGESGIHDASWVDLSMNLPLTIEFFDHQAKIEPALEYLNTIIKAEHIIWWKAMANDHIKK